VTRHPRTVPAAGSRQVVLLLGGCSLWADELQRLVDPNEWEFVVVDDIDALPRCVGASRVRAILLPPRPWSGREIVVLRECRELSPGTAMVVMAEDPVDLPLKRASEHGATTFLRWPSSPEIFLQAITSGASPELPGRQARRKQVAR
jgi:DNA-binding NtrC family response regulator